MGEEEAEITLMLGDGQKVSFSANTPQHKKDEAWGKFWNSWRSSNKKNGSRQTPEKRQNKKKKKKAQFKSF